MRPRSVLSGLGGLACAGAVVAGLVLTISQPTTSAADELVPALILTPAQATESLNRLANGVFNAQAKVLADRRITVAEYENAVEDTLDCVVADIRRAAVARGLPVTITKVDPELSDDAFVFTYSYSVAVPPGTEIPADAQTEIATLERACQARHMDRVSVAYEVQQMASTSYTRNVAERFTECLDDAGVDVEPTTDGTTAREKLADILDEAAADPESDAVTCIDETPAITASPLASVNFLLTGSPTG